MEARRTHKPLELIFEATWKSAGVDPLLITQKNPGKVVSAFKQVGIYIARQHGHPFQAIAKVFGLKSHVSAIYANDQITGNKKDPFISSVIEKVMGQLYS